MDEQNCICFCSSNKWILKTLFVNFAHTRTNNIIRQVLFIILLILLGALIFRELSFLIGGALGAVTFYVVLKRPYVLLVEKYRWNKNLAAFVLILILIIFFLSFGVATFEMVISKMSDFDNKALQQGLHTITDKIKDLTGYQIRSSMVIDQFKETFVGKASGMLNSAYGFIINLLMLIFILYFMLVNYIKMESTIIRLIPFRGGTLAQIVRETENMIVSNAIGIPAMMIAQGSVAMLGYWIFDVDDPVFWGVITGFFSIIPIVGTTVIWGGLSIYLLSIGHLWQGLGLLIYSAIIIGSMDNVVRIILGRYMANTHPLVTILGVIMGLSLFGFWGIIFGPLMIDLFILLFKIYRAEYLHEQEKDREVPTEKQTIEL